MHGLVNRSLENFVRDVYGDDVWMAVAAAAAIEPPTFEAMLDYDDATTRAVVDAAVVRLRKPREVLLEDLGTYLVSHPNMSRIRRLLRFGGQGFVDFLDSLDDLPDRVRLAVPALAMPSLRLVACGQMRYRLYCGEEPDGGVHVILGILRAMADDYGALAFVDFSEEAEGCGRSGDLAIDISVLSTSFAEGRSFRLEVQST